MDKQRERKGFPVQHFKPGPKSVQTYGQRHVEVRRGSNSRPGPNSKGFQPKKDLLAGPPPDSSTASDKYGLGKPISKENMQKMLQSSSNDIILSILTPRCGFVQRMESKEMDDDTFELVLAILEKALYAENVPGNVVELLHVVSKSNFVRGPTTKYLVKLSTQPSARAAPLVNLLNILQKLQYRLPSASMAVVTQLTALMQPLLQKQTCNKDFQALNAKVREIEETCVEVTKQIHGGELVRDQEENDEFDVQPPDDFRTLPVVPTAKDISAGAKPFLRKNVVHGTYRDVDHYLDVQFRLFREDFVAPLRQGIRELSQPGAKHYNYHQDIRVYTEVKILEPHCTQDGVVHSVTFSTSHLQKVTWESSKRLIYGSLVCLSKNRFKTVLFGVISERDPKLLRKGNVEIAFEENSLQMLRNNPYDAYEMVESTAYFGAYRHNLKGLQEVKVDCLPFCRYLLDGKNAQVRPPKYLRLGNVSYNFGCLMTGTVSESEQTKDNRAEDTEQDKENRRRIVRTKPDHSIGLRQWTATLPVARRPAIGEKGLHISVLETGSWPTAAELQLDNSQYRALQSALTKEFVLIQGPPGTGKTFIGLKIVEILLNNQQAWNGEDRRPILVVCYTNHALDQFLEGVLNFFQSTAENELIRVGGRSSSEKLDKCKLANVRKNIKDKEDILPANIRDGLRDVNDAMDELALSIEYLSKRIELLRKGIVHEKYLAQAMAPHQFVSLCNRAYVLGSQSHIVDWLVGNVLTGEDTENDHEFTTNVEDDAKGKNSGNDTDEEEVRADDFGRKIEEDKDMQKQFRKQLKGMNSVPEVALSQTSLRKTQLCEADGYHTVQGKTNRKVLSAMRRGLDGKDLMSEKEARKATDVWELRNEDRWRLYRLWFLRYYEESCRYLHTQYFRYNNLAKRRKEYKEEEDYRIISRATVVGLTTTGAAKYRGILQRVQPKIVIVEEAAEVFEAHIVTTLSENCEQLLLIGDHQQLRPSPTVYKLAKDYHLDVSLFERMVKNEMACDRLSIQHRMRPEIAKLIVPHVYKELYNHESVLRYDHVMGVKEDIFLINHSEMEENDEDTKSHSNVHEAEYLLALCQYLLQQGYKSTEITILTTYTGQMFNIRSAIRNKVSGGMDSLDGIRVTPVDNYQGEENEIILLSLVRSNAEGQIGFLKVANRVCVALSRAKKGFYAIGNMKLLSEGSILWNQIVEDLKKENRVGEALCLMCQNHPETSTLAKTARDFAQVADGGCHLPCAVRLKCGHACVRMCHPTDRDHKEYKCMKSCLRSPCEMGHRCPKLCHEDCGNCLVPVEKVMPECQHLQMVACHKDVKDVKCNYVIPDREWPCGHKLTVQCHFTPHNLKCTVTVTKKLPDCHHEHEFSCSDEVNSYNCKELVEVTCQRGHTRTVKCCYRKKSKCQEEVEAHCKYEKNHRFKVKCSKVEEAVCSVSCQRELPCGHPCSELCGICRSSGVHPVCKEPCKKLLPCGHPCEGRCGEICKPCLLFCPPRCAHHSCKKRCGYSCKRCYESCRWECPHQKCTKRCHEQCDRRPCNAPCPLKLTCGHLCAGLCGEPCPSQCRTCHCDYYKDLEERSGLRFTDKSRFVALQPCRHVFEVEHMDSVILRQKPGEYPRLPHVYTCPGCQSVITFCPRYGKVIKASLQEVDAVKGQIDYWYQAKETVDLLLETFGLAAERLFSSRLADTKWLGDNTKLVQIVLGCCQLLAEIEKLRRKTDFSEKRKQVQEGQGKDFVAYRAHTDDEASVERLGELLKESYKKLRDCLQRLDVDEIKKISEDLKVSYLKAHMQVMLLFTNNRKRREDLHRWLHPLPNPNTRSESLRRLFYFNKDKSVNTEAGGHVSIESEQSGLGGSFIEIANMLKVRFTPKQRNDVEDFLFQIHRFFNLQLDGIATTGSQRWEVCHNGHAFLVESSSASSSSCSKCPIREKVFSRDNRYVPDLSWTAPQYADAPVVEKEIHIPSAANDVRSDERGRQRVNLQGYVRRAEKSRRGRGSASCSKNEQDRERSNQGWARGAWRGNPIGGRAARGNGRNDIPRSRGRGSARGSRNEQDRERSNQGWARGACRGNPIGGRAARGNGRNDIPRSRGRGSARGSRNEQGRGRGNQGGTRGGLARNPIRDSDATGNERGTHRLTSHSQSYGSERAGRRGRRRGRGDVFTSAYTSTAQKFL